jgi:hypothetical protein
MATACMLLLLGIAAGACSDASGPTTPTEPDLAPPYNLRAYSDDSTIGLSWDRSVDEGRLKFGSYAITLWDKATGDTVRKTAAAGTSSMRLRPLRNGDRYELTMVSVSSGGTRGSLSSSIEWSPARRVVRDIAGQFIRVYTSISSLPSGVDLLADSAHAEVLDVTSTAFATRGDFYLYTPSFVGIIQLMNPQISPSNPGQVTKFSSVSGIPASSLNDAPATSSPAFSTYTLDAVTIDYTVMDKGRIFFGRTQRGSIWYYFRVLVKSADGSLIQGFGADRYLELEASFQTGKSVPFAKR